MTYIVIEKSESFLYQLEEILKKFDIKGSEVNIEIHKLMGDPDNPHKRYSNKLYTDLILTFENKGINIQIFFGKDRVIFSIVTTKDKQKKISNIMFEYCDFK